MLQNKLKEKRNHQLINSHNLCINKAKGLHKSFLNQSNKLTNFKSENWTPRKLSSMYRVNYEVVNSTQPERVSKELDTNRNKNIKIFQEISYKNLENERGKRTTNISLVESSSNHSSTSQNLKQVDKQKHSSFQNSTNQSPNKKIHTIESKNKKKLCDYQQDKRSQVPTSNLVIVMNEKHGKQENSFSKYLKSDKILNNKKSANNEYEKVKKEKADQKLAIDVKQNTFTIDSETNIYSGKVNDTNEHANDGKDQKLKALQNMPIKKFIVYNKEETKYKLSEFEEEKKLQFSEEIPANIQTLVSEKTQNKTTTKIASESYRIGKILGKGAFGKVNLAIHKESGELVAIKSINKSYLSDNASKNKVMQEVTILKMIKHKNIIWLKETFETDTHIIFVMELWSGGDLLNYVRKRRKLNENTAKVVFKQILEGLHHCHKNNVLHRDIKLDNILLDSKGEVKLGDFGVSKIVSENEIITDQWGTPAYIAPEILLDMGYKGYGIDVWSAGVVLYAMWYGTVPFKAHNMNDLHSSIINAKYSIKDTISEKAIDLIKHILEPDPNLRYTIPQILSHSWFEDMNENIELFNDQEKEKILKEFTFNNTARFNRNHDNLDISKDEVHHTSTTDSFIEYHLSTQNSMVRNHSTKSIILAPFNSTITEIAEETKKLIRENMQDRKCIKFSAKWKDVNKQYEMNNNWELDNGVYNKFVLEEEKQEKED